MAILSDLMSAIGAGSIEVVDLTAPLTSKTPILALPEEFGQTWPFALEQISKYDAAGPAWYWNNISTGEHTGTHFDAPIHWVTGRDNLDVSQVPVGHLIAPAAVIDVSAQAAADADFLLEVDHIKAWEQRYGPLPAGGWLLVRTGWDARSADSDAFLND
ncbi:MAG TPA: cyclase family protein, partial [Micromonosporaceae bacterium]